MRSVCPECLLQQHSCMAREAADSACAGFPGAFTILEFANANSYPRGARNTSWIAVRRITKNPDYGCVKELCRNTRGQCAFTAAFGWGKAVPCSRFSCPGWQLALKT